MITIITIERGYGCGAREIARELARRLDWKLWDERLTEEIQRQSGQRPVPAELQNCVSSTKFRNQIRLRTAETTRSQRVAGKMNKSRTH
jgi:cytidylate kinase-like protein